LAFEVELVESQVREGIMVFEFCEIFFAAEAPSEMVVVRDEDHVVGVYCAERSKAVANYCEKGDEDIVNYVYEVVFAVSNADPAWHSSQFWGGGGEEEGERMEYRSRKEPMLGQRW
jgi:hypothetical protein